jgi:glycosyltransferase involved in cell wall biosynthesis
MTIHRLSQGGADRVAMLLANGFAASGFTTQVLVLREGGEAEDTLRALLRKDVQVSTAGAPIGSRHLELVRGVRHIRRNITASKPAIVLASSSNMGLVTGICARMERASKYRPRFIMKLTNPVFRPVDAGWIRTFYRRHLYNFIFASYDRVLILTDEERLALIKVYPKHRDRFQTVANPYVAPAMLVPVPQNARMPGAHLVALARMMPQKRLDRLLRAFAMVADQSIRLTILGDGPRRATLILLAKQLGIERRIEMPGFVEDVVPWLRSADLLVLSSDYEGLPAVVLEALACNVPVVTTHCFAGARSLLESLPRCAVVDRDTVPAFAAAIEWSLAQRDTPAKLSLHAQPYGFEAAIAAHVAIAADLAARGAGSLQSRMVRRLQVPDATALSPTRSVELVQEVCVLATVDNRD